MARPHLMANKFLKLAHKGRDLDPDATKIVKDDNIAQLDVSCKVTRRTNTPNNIMW